MTDSELNSAWFEKFGQTGKFAEDESKLNLDNLDTEQQRKVGLLVAYYFPTEKDADVFIFYMNVLRVPNRPIMLTLLED